MSSYGYFVCPKFFLVDIPWVNHVKIANINNTGKNTENNSRQEFVKKESWLLLISVCTTN